MPDHYRLDGLAPLGRFTVTAKVPQCAVNPHPEFFQMKHSKKERLCWETVQTCNLFAGSILQIGRPAHRVCSVCLPTDAQSRI